MDIVIKDPTKMKEIWLTEDAELADRAEAEDAMHAAEDVAEAEAETPANDTPPPEPTKPKKSAMREPEGGAAFCDELLTFAPDALVLLKEAGKTLHGLYNYAYSVARAAAMNAHAHSHERCIGEFSSTIDALRAYLSPDIAEGYMVPMPTTTPTPSAVQTAATPKPAKKTRKTAAVPPEIAAVVKQAAADAQNAHAAADAKREAVRAAAAQQLTLF